MSANAAALTWLMPPGESEEAKIIAENYSQAVESLKNSYSYMVGFRESFSELAEVAEECKTQNWDGYNAEPINRQSIELAHKFLEALDLGMPGPEIGAVPDGCVTLDWFSRGNQTLSITIGADGTLYYAAEFGGNDLNGTACFVDEITPFISSLIVQATR